MRTSKALVGVLMVVVLAMGTAAQAEDYEYIGTKKCSMCHKKDAGGNQLAKWEAGPHSKAYETLAGEASLAAAKELGIENPQADPKCLKCHATAFAVMADLENQKITLEDGVSCESCHGAGSGYYKKKTMEGIAAGEIEAASVGLVHPGEEVCKGCHNEESPTFKGFDYEEMVAKVAHPIPDVAEAAAE
jgi:hypothetical protein